MVSSSKDRPRPVNEGPLVAGRRVLLNLLIAYLVGAAVLFAIAIFNGIDARQSVIMHLQQAVGDTLSFIGLYAIASPLVLAALVLLDWLLRRVKRPRALAIVAAVAPAVIWFGVARVPGEFPTTSLWLAATGLCTAVFLRLPRAGS